MQSGGVLWYDGSGGTTWFASNGSGGYTSPAGPLNSSTLVLNGGGTYTLTDKLGNAENFSSAGLLTSTVDTNGNTTSYAYSSGKLSTITDAYSRTTTFNYTSGLVSSIVDIGSQTTTLAYTSGKLTSITAPVPATGISAPVTSYAYTGNLLTTITDPDSNATTLAYSFAGRISTATFADSSTEQFTPAETAGVVNTSSGTGTSSSTPAAPYNVTHDHSMLVDELSNQSTTQFDVFGDVTSSTDPLSLTKTSVYNANGQLTSQTDKNGRVSNFTYDNLGRMTQEQWMSSGTAIYTATYAYDAAGAVSSASDNYSTYAYTYNADKLVTQVDNSGTATGPHVVLNVTYDGISRLSSLSATVAGTLDFLNNYSYDAAGNVTQITQQSQTGGNSVAPKVVNLTYNADGQFTAINRYANLAATQLVATSTSGYNADGELTSLSHDKGGTNLNSYTWTYDHMARLTADTVGAASDSYTYDAASELTGATHSGGGNETYSYDSNGNRTNTGYSTGTNNQLSSDGTYNYLYDASGNMTKKTTISSGAYVTFTWDYRNRLTDVQAYNSSNVLQSHEHYNCDVFDRLIEKQVDPTGGGTYTTAQSFIYDGANVILVYNGSGTLTDRLLNGPDANQPLADENGSGVVSWFLTDREGTVVDVVQYNSGTNTTTVVDHLVYAAFGSITSQTNSTYQPLFAYTGQMWDAAANLYYYHARWYDANDGRFISQDPTGFAAGDANLYRYTGNSPTNAIDPTGMDGEPAGKQTAGKEQPKIDEQTQLAQATDQQQQAQARRSAKQYDADLQASVDRIANELDALGGTIRAQQKERDDAIKQLIDLMVKHATMFSSKKIEEQVLRFGKYAEIIENYTFDYYSKMREMNILMAFAGSPSQEYFIKQAYNEAAKHAKEKEMELSKSDDLQRSQIDRATEEAEKRVLELKLGRPKDRFHGDMQSGIEAEVAIEISKAKRLSLMMTYMIKYAEDKVALEQEGIINLRRSYGSMREERNIKQNIAAAEQRAKEMMALKVELSMYYNYWMKQRPQPTGR